MKEGYAFSSTEDIDNPEKGLRKKSNRNDFKETYIWHDKNNECSKYVEKNSLGNIFMSKKIKNEEDTFEGSNELCRILNDTLPSNYCFKNNKQNMLEIKELDKNINIINSKDQQYCDDEAILLYNIRRMYESNTKYTKNNEKEKNNYNISNVNSFKYNNIYKKNSENNSTTNESDIFQSVSSSKSYNDIFKSLNQEKKKNKKNKFINNYENIINMKYIHMNNIGDIKNQPIQKYSQGFMKNEKMEVASISFKSLSDDEKNYSFIQTFNDMNEKNINENVYKKESKKNIKYNNKQNDDNQKKLQNYKELSTNFLLSQKDIKKGSVINNEKLEKEKCKYKKNMSFVKNNMLRKNTMKKQNIIKINKLKMTNSTFPNIHLTNTQENDTIKFFSQKNIEKSNESLKYINKSIIGRSSICSYDKLENLKNNFTEIKKNVKNAKRNTYNTIHKKLENSSTINKYKLNNFLQDKGICDCVNKYNTFSSFENFQRNNIKVISSLHENKCQKIAVLQKEKDSSSPNNLHIEKYTYNKEDNKNIKYMYNLKDAYCLKKVNTKSIGVQINVKKKTFNKKTNTVNIFYLDKVNKRKIPKIKFKTIKQIYNYDFDAIMVKDGHIISRNKDPLKEMFQRFFEKV
ncbi:hypothetical protein PFAG_03513 [Plasmodium falciparum Santa Lucia]|uniref:Uncharacterized protein n=12 Tax=Plasmodium falciparum TaxID=5833 RepID=Q8IHX0_PLAF7|nr:conserved Plasmodium protein, unknown function [Plasmodium falciparum 3D7]ETW15290.1 hypothetical protein PFFVO_05584 [Plasmodium falciparum Vietnam Oak-Knoll (FVO)]ETW30250.1 hypothetical protein PFFCH_02266 [Plasmodium falciparum FCH/4]ETW35779.1 hypothetical protein PFTANZ_03528 [Plasmodium falciparum Tanzania (2000708)]ETW42179.1 hypothetical protein PFNF135_03677 [Plasmodium falciparum NF135/5.C10]ETW48489.1 hypothetical protein PFMALIP_03463 [Plasmodium falciparum MaliPS096_E11]ETW54|eukprot:XP_001348076.1 conserved Plasmodium protein, unknown function [Plasmodium falciparum 3D7]